MNISCHSFVPFKSYWTSNHIGVAIWNVWNYDFVGFFHIFPWASPINVAQYSSSSASPISINSFNFVPHRASRSVRPTFLPLIVY